MAVTVQPEPEDLTEAPAENCCFCCKPTRFWVVNFDVACCPACAGRASINDVPTKAVWCRRERIAKWDAYILSVKS